LGLKHGQNININSRKLDLLLFINKMKIIRLTTVEKDVFYGMGERRGDGMTAMNNYQSFLQTNTKTGKLFKKGF
jgi:hypothetical protein